MNISRLLIVVLAVFAFFAILILKLFSVQVLRSEELQYFAKRQQTAVLDLPPERGFIYDRNNTLLAYSSNDVSFYVDVPLAEKYNSVGDIIKEFYKHFERPEGYYENLFNSGKKRICLEKKVDPSKALEVKKLVLDGLYFEEDPTRTYQYNNFAAHVLGYTNTDHMGTGGIEKEFEEELRGVRGSQTIIRSPGGRMITVLEGSEQPPVNGSSVVLTIDKEYQSILEEELEAGLKSSGGKYAVGIILDPNTGEVLALANEKSYDPGKYNLVDDETRRNKAVTDVYEPGSTFKAIAMAAMLDKDLVHPEELIFVDNGSYRFKGITIRDVHGYNSLTVKGVFAKSSNIGMAKLSGRIKKEDLYKYVRGFGFGNTTQISLPGEVRGLLKHPNLWSAYTKVTMSYGYEIAVTPIQLISAYAAVINGGVLYKPQIVKRIELPNGNAVKQFEPEQVRRVISEETSTVMREFLKEVVENGTGKNAHIEGVSIGGKTGTSRRVVDGKYSYSQYNASFIGFFPAEKPSYIILIMVNSPKNGYYGGTVAAPIFKKITERMLHNHPLPEEYDDEDLPENRLPNPMNVFNTNDSETTESEFAFEEHNPLGRITDNRKMPDLKGLSIREAVLVLSELQLEYRIKGTGPVYNQSIKAGTVLKDEMICTIHGEALTVLNRRLY